MQIVPLKFDSAQKSDKARIAMPDARRAEAASSPEAAGYAAFSRSAASYGSLSLAGGFLDFDLEKIPASEDLKSYVASGSEIYTLHASHMPMKAASRTPSNSSVSLTSSQGLSTLVTKL